MKKKICIVELFNKQTTKKCPAGNLHTANHPEVGEVGESTNAHIFLQHSRNFQEFSPGRLSENSYKTSTPQGTKSSSTDTPERQGNSWTKPIASCGTMACQGYGQARLCTCSNVVIKITRIKRIQYYTITRPGLKR